MTNPFTIMIGCREISLNMFRKFQLIKTSGKPWEAEDIYCFGSFQSKAKKAYEKAKEAIEDESKYPSIANSEWRDIYGDKFPLL